MYKNKISKQSVEIYYVNQLLFFSLYVQIDIYVQ